MKAAGTEESALRCAPSPAVAMDASRTNRVPEQNTPGAEPSTLCSEAAGRIQIVLVVFVRRVVDVSQEDVARRDVK